MKKVMMGFAALLMAVAMISCKPAPQAQVEEAQAALDSAKAVEADRYLAVEFVALNDSLVAAQAAIEAEQAKPFGERDFAPIREKLEGIAASAETLKANAEVRKAEVRTQVEGLLVDLGNRVTENKANLALVVVTARNRATVEALQNEITVLESAITEVNTLVANGDYLTALEKATGAQVKASEVATGIAALAPRR
ncbi:MAG TPA: hypothetical protein VLH61_01745 [Bacteroidales bacterium]|nr:hypothetical protein [Bacteroidales bacterium]